MGPTSTKRDTVFRRAFGCVRGMTVSDTPFERIEAFIETCEGLDQEERAVLWLLAWMGGKPSEVAGYLGRDTGDPMIRPECVA